MNLVAGADIAVAGGTLILAIFTWRATEASRSAAEATGPAAEAAQIEADATVQLAQEAREDRELAWRPYLVVDPITTTSDAKVTYKVQNIGRGPATDVIIWAYRYLHGPGTWGRVPVGALAAGASKEGGFPADQIRPATLLTECSPR